VAIANETKTVVGVFNSVTEAQQAVTALEGEGISRDQISVVANKNAAGYDTGAGVDKASDVVADAGIGAAIGGVGGLLLSVAGAITLPVIGPILAAGPIAAALTGAGIGAAAGGLVGALTESGIPEEEAKYYAEGVRRGDVLVTVQADSSRIDRVCDLLDRYNAIDVEERVSGWKGRGWSGYQDTEKPLNTDELRSERSYYGVGSSGTGTMGMGGMATGGVPGSGSSTTVGSLGTSGDSAVERGARRTTEGLKEAGRDVKDWAHDAKEKVKDWGQDAKRGLERAGDKVEDASDDAKRGVKHAGHEIADSARAGRDISDDARNLERERRYRSRVYDRTI